MERDQELQARTLSMGSFVMWPPTDKGKQRKPSADGIKLNKALWDCNGHTLSVLVCVEIYFQKEGKLI